MNVQEAYETLQENCGIKVGDKVKVLRTAEMNELGWANNWTASMDSAVGNIFEVKYLNSEGIGLSLDFGYFTTFGFPFFVLEKIEKVSAMEITIREIEHKYIGCKIKIIGE